MNSQITEFSFGFALTRELVNTSPFGTLTAPQFPSLSGEGAPGGGYDVALNFGTFLFLQFKLTEFMVRNSAGEAAIGLPYYRFWVMPHPESQQHPMLLDLEHAGEFVFYAAPEFWTQGEFNDAYITREVMASSVFVRPSLIGGLPPNEWHAVAFNQHAAGVFSRHTQIDVLRGNALIDTLQAGTQTNTKPADARQLAFSMSSIAKERKLKTPEPPESQDPRLTLSYISYLAHCFFHSEVFFRPQS